MHLLFGGITDRIEKRHTETGAGNDGIYAAAVTAAKRTSPSRKLRQQAEIGSVGLCVSGNVESDRASSSKRGTSICSDFNYCVDLYDFVGQTSGRKWGNVNDNGSWC